MLPKQYLFLHSLYFDSLPQYHLSDPSDGTQGWHLSECPFRWQHTNNHGETPSQSNCIWLDQNCQPRLYCLVSIFLCSPLYCNPVLLSHPDQHCNVTTKPNLLGVSGWSESDITRLAGMGYYLHLYSCLPVLEIGHKNWFTQSKYITPLFKNSGLNTLWQQWYGLCFRWGWVHLSPLLYCV